MGRVERHRKHRRPLRARWAEPSGQALSEWLVLTGLVTGLAILVFGRLGVSARLMLRETAMRILSVVTGTP